MALEVLLLSNYYGVTAFELAPVLRSATRVHKVLVPFKRRELQLYLSGVVIAELSALSVIESNGGAWILRPTNQWMEMREKTNNWQSVLEPTDGTPEINGVGEGETVGSSLISALLFTGYANSV